MVFGCVTPRRRHAAVTLLVAGALLIGPLVRPIVAQPPAAELRVHVGTAVFFEASQHFTGGSSYRKYFSERGWGIEPEYTFMTDGSHQDHLLILNVVKDFTMPSRTVVPYMVMGAGINFYRGLDGRDGVTFGGLGLGVGFKAWRSDRVFIAPEFRIGAEPNLRFSLSMGFTRREIPRGRPRSAPTHPVLGQARPVDVRAVGGYAYGLDDSPPYAWVGGGTVTVPRGEHSRFGVEVWHATLYGPYFSGLAARALGVTALWEYEFSPGQRVNPYAVVGGGLTKYRTLYSDFTYPGVDGWDIQHVPHISGGLGVRWFLTQQVFVATEVRLGLVPIFRPTLALGYTF